MRIYKKLLIIIFFVLFELFIASNSIYAAELFVSLSGNDNSGDGSISTPYRTFNKAGKTASPGDMINVRGGTYNERINIYNVDGLPNNHIIFQPYNNEVVTIDGSSLSISGNNSLVFIGSSEYLTFRGFEVKNSSARGLSYYESNNILIQKNIVHDIYSRSIGGGGDFITIDNNELYNNSLENNNSSMCSSNGGCSGWPGVIQTARKADCSLATNIIITNNIVHDSWGEGIIANFSDGLTIANNTIYNTFSTNIYVDSSRNVTVDSNYLYNTNSRYNRPDKSPPVPATGISMAAEDYSEFSCGSPNILIENILIKNNILSKTGKGISYWYDSSNTNSTNSYKNINIYHNTIHNPQVEPIRIFKVGSSGGNPTSSVVANNIIYKGTINNTHYSIGDPAVWSFKNNLWVDELPTSELIDHSSDYSTINPMLNSPVTGGPESGFKITQNLFGGSSIANVNLDYFGGSRNLSSPSIGAHELLLPVLTPTPLPTSNPSDPMPTAVPLTPTIGLTPIPTITEFRSADFDKDRDVDRDDYNFMKDRFFGEDTNALLSDINNDNRVDIKDYSILVVQWGSY